MALLDERSQGEFALEIGTQVAINRHPDEEKELLQKPGA